MTGPMIPRCEHGNIILGCPFDDCPDQTDYIVEFNGVLARYNDHQQQAARRFVREALGLEDS